MFVICYGKHTQNLLMAEAHNVHGLHGLMEVVFVLLPWNWNVTIGQEPVVVESFQKQVRYGQKNGKTFRRMVKMYFMPKCKESRGLTGLFFFMLSIHIILVNVLTNGERVLKRWSD